MRERLWMKFRGAITKDECIAVWRAFHKIRDGSSSFLSGEYKKTFQELWMIKIAEEGIGKLLRSFGVEPIRISDQQIHFLDEDSYRVLYDGSPRREGLSLGRASIAQIEINKDTNLAIGGMSNLFCTVIHECLHMQCKFVSSFSKFQTLRWESTRLGYHYRSDKKERFSGFNEMLTNIMALRVMRATRWQCAVAGISVPGDEESVERHLKMYVPFSSIFAALIEKMSAEDARCLIRGMFNGEMKALRSVEKIFGRRSVRLLALLNNRGKYAVRDGCLVYRALLSTDSKERDGVIRLLEGDFWETLRYRWLHLKVSFSHFFLGLQDAYRLVFGA